MDLPPMPGTPDLSRGERVDMEHHHLQVCGPAMTAHGSLDPISKKP
jgi:hypothetical protein